MKLKLGMVGGQGPSSERSTARQHGWTVRGNPGVHMLGPSKFKATIKLKGKTVHLGYFTTPEAANEAFVTAREVARKPAGKAA